ncbi:MAG: MFS transporter [Alphaproteobacteria bacterium]|nr:MFS transporter [Alphaproteobacteria bacterium]
MTTGSRELNVTQPYSRGAAIARMAPVLSIAFILAHFLRSAPAVIAPDLRAELALTPGQLSSLPAAIFLGAALMQLPVGVLLDRFGPRRTMFGFIVVAGIGTLVFATAQGIVSLAVALFLIGCGAAPVFMGVMVLLSRWVARDRLATATAVSIAIGGAGMLLSASPFAAAAEAFGWRQTLMVVGFAAFGIAAALFFTVRDRPEDAPAPANSESLREIIYGLRHVLGDKRVYSFAAVTAVAVGTLVTVRNLWIGPYLNDVFDLDTIARGNVIFVVSVTWIISALTYGPLDRLFDTRRGVVTGGLLLFAGATALLAVNSSPSVLVVTILLSVFTLTSAMASPLFAHARSLFPDHFSGRVFTAINVFTWSGVFLVQMGTGALLDAFPVDELGRSPAIAYRTMFGMLAVGLILVLIIYRRVDDVPPSTDTGEPATDRNKEHDERG